MKIITKKFDDLSVFELYEILKLREKVFVYEQKCTDYEIDGLDQIAIHIALFDNNKLCSYLRILKEDDYTYKIGRVLAEEKLKGYGKIIMDEALNYIKKLKAKKIIIESQVQAIGFYKKFGFSEASDVFMEAGILHIKMIKEL